MRAHPARFKFSTTWSVCNGQSFQNVLQLVDYVNDDDDNAKVDEISLDEAEEIELDCSLTNFFFWNVAPRPIEK